RPDPQGPPAAQGGTGPQTARRPRGSHGAQDLQAPQDARFSGPLSPGNLSAGPAGVSGPAGRSPDLAQGQAAGRASAWPAGQGEAAEGLLTLQAPPAEAEQRTEAVDLLAAENPSRARSGNLRGTLRRGPGVRGGAAGTGPAAAQAGGAPPEGPAVTAAAGSQAGQAAPGARARTGSSDGEAAADPAPADSPLTGRAAAAAWARLAFRPERAKASGGGEGLRSDAGPAAREGESAGDAARSLYDGPF
ncbi:MAG: hypothetical protein LBW85_09100, partial [Deltaproteobacteria bacterium]|nr:hypothetical protein [Deltaproteobacteria bacterium]